MPQQPDAKPEIPSATDLRVALAKRPRRLPQYQLAAAAKVNPTALSAILNGRAPVAPDVARRILAAIESAP